MISTSTLQHIKDTHGSELSDFENQLLDSHLQANRQVSVLLHNFRAIQRVLDAINRGDLAEAIAAALTIKP
ncbi:hypothetical protein PBI_MRMAGOO_155 [Mycobacterium phage MrMagoo]|uniref:Uncharacterized protein n=1 Tax=Mycobacterium phage MrMagoo TaxID=1927020 RepID=A0A1L6BYQ3_9CAUD|nr:hypothetical protein J4U04_gp125 [Mycobacterium phage MrMagoo]APQ42237.1 hypothetical protein PBI_MRMAGOO_155 [Mycobacterium phage MrMagoo]ARM70306.1 hypothetical protein SEA_GARDENSALSA_153 [Mycobacterium phage GardenSalsa]